MNSHEKTKHRNNHFLIFLLFVSLTSIHGAFAETFEHIPNAAISGHNDKHLINVSVNDCKIACKNETTFTCKSFDYYKGLNKCDLSSKNAELVGSLKHDYTNNPYDHYVRTNTFSRIPNSALSGYNNVQLTGVTAEQCREACLNRTDFYCKSFDYYNAQAKCDLSSENAVGGGSLYSSVAYDHHVRELSSTAKVKQFHSYQFLGEESSPLLWSSAEVFDRPEIASVITYLDSNFWPGDWFKFNVNISNISPGEKIAIQVIINYNGDAALDIQEAIYLDKNQPPANSNDHSLTRIATIDYTGNTKEVTYYSQNFVGTCQKNSYATKNPHTLIFDEIKPPVAKTDTNIYFKVFSLSTNTEIFSQIIPFLHYYESISC